MRAKSQTDLTEGYRARARQTSPCHRFVPDGRLALATLTDIPLRAEVLQELLYELRKLALRGITLRAEAIQELLYELLLYKLSFPNGSSGALRVTCSMKRFTASCTSS